MTMLQRLLGWILPDNVWHQQRADELTAPPYVPGSRLDRIENGPPTLAHPEQAMPPGPVVRGDFEGGYSIRTWGELPDEAGPHVVSRSVPCTCRPGYNPDLVPDVGCFAHRQPEPAPTHTTVANGPIRVTVRPRYKN